MTRPTQDRHDQGAQVADLVAEYLVALREGTDLDPAAILAGAHAAVVTLMVQSYGGQEAAECFQRAAERVRHIPSLAAVQLAVAEPAGRA